MNTELNIELWKKFARYWQPAEMTVAGRGDDIFVDSGGEEINPFMDEDEFDLDDELAALFDRD